MIKKLRCKFVLIIMCVVTLILLAIFFTMLVTTQKNNEKMSVGMLHQALNIRTFPGELPNPIPPDVRGIMAIGVRQPVLVVEVTRAGKVTVLSNQLHFIGESDIAPIVNLALEKNSESGVLSSYDLRFLKREQAGGTRIALADITLEREMLRAQIIVSLLISGTAILVFFFLSIFLSRRAVRPMETAWERQKQFIANASHELKTPLTVILSNADILQKNVTDGDEKNAVRLEHIHAEAKRMKSLVEDMLTLARSDSAEAAPVHTALDFSYTVKSAVLMYEAVFYDENKNFSYRIEDGLTVSGDAERLRQLAHILLDNARKYSLEGGSIEIVLKRHEPHTLLFRVSNSGAPIPKSELESIFLRFYRRDEARSADGSFGLGLAIAQSITGEHRGKIWAESGETGNSFFVMLPAE